MEKIIKEYQFLSHTTYKAKSVLKKKKRKKEKAQTVKKKNW